MSRIAKDFGMKVKFFRTQKDMSQEKLAELCGLHPTYIGQVERGEKNCTLKSAEKISKGLKIPIEKLMGTFTPLDDSEDIPHQIYDKLLRLSDKDQKSISTIINDILDYKFK